MFMQVQNFRFAVRCNVWVNIRYIFSMKLRVVIRIILTSVFFTVRDRIRLQLLS